MDREPTPLALALAAAAHGYAVFPLGRTKRPALPSPHRPPAAPAPDSGTGSVPPTGPGPQTAPVSATPGTPPGSPAPCRGACGLPGHGVYDASTEPSVIRALFARAPHASGYGIACGLAPHHLLGLDLDTKHGADPLRALVLLGARHGFVLPVTLRVATPSGGAHLWFSAPAGRTVRNSAGRLAPGIDVRGAGGYLVGPGSRTTRGVYRFLPGAPPGPPRPAPAPEALLRLLAPSRRPVPYALHRHPGDHERATEALLRFVRASLPGERNTRLYWAACRVGESGLASTAVAARLVAAAHATGLPTHEAARTVASAFLRTAPGSATGPVTTAPAGTTRRRGRDRAS
ncbi:bifunctional DNA primase/polymerase [Streptomyces sp. SPB074]|uniref:bifunctional DNA primase/polymerase n=1 Tax=Streptomyces sp. (strain SPB074) TaxID=465543 RepID=UPI00017F182E|nr:bifunctional DNA primase/polymerase [Streptomyces sp. SPB074]EDY46851.1 N- superfamily bifunctional DNA primase/polymerase [Streptomyces sp. SPB074]